MVAFYKPTKRVRITWRISVDREWEIGSFFFFFRGTLIILTGLLYAFTLYCAVLQVVSRMVTTGPGLADEVRIFDACERSVPKKHGRSVPLEASFFMAIFFFFG